MYEACAGYWGKGTKKLKIKKNQGFCPKFTSRRGNKPFAQILQGHEVGYYYLPLKYLETFTQHSMTELTELK